MLNLLYEGSDKEFFTSALEAVFTFLSLKGNAYVELEILSKEEMKALNLKSRNIDKVTDVLSFPYLEKIMPFSKESYPFDYDDELNAVSLGSIVICKEKAIEQAKEYNNSFEREYSYLFIHGLLHLLGYDHENEQDKRQMREAEEGILRAVAL